MSQDGMSSAAGLWQDYLLLTREMAKCLDHQDYTMFHEIMRQRERLQELIEQAADNEFTRSAQGQELYQELMQQNTSIQQKLELLRNTARRQQEVSQAYDAYSQSTGGWMDRKS